MLSLNFYAEKIFLFTLLTVLFECQASFAAKNDEFTFGGDKVLAYRLVNSVNNTDTPIYYGSDIIAPKLEYCYYVHEQLDKSKFGIGLGMNKFFYSSFNPFNVYAIWKVVFPPINDKCTISVGSNYGYGILNDKYEDEATQETFKVDKVYSIKLFLRVDTIVIIDLSVVRNMVPYYIITNEGVKSVLGLVNYDAIMLGIGYKFAI
jgi:hypothetical protein